MDVDVAIIGDGPSGCSAALTLLGKGYSVALVSKPNTKQKPTETATPALKQLLVSIKAEEALAACDPCFGICSDWGRSSFVLQSSIAGPFGHAWFIHRARFDKCMRNITRKAGGICLTASAYKANFDAKGVTLLTTEGTIHANWLIAASGSVALSAQITDQILISIDSLIAYWKPLPADLTERLLFVESSNFGWWYACPGDGNGIIACLVTDIQSARSLDLARGTNWNDLFGETTLFRQLGCKTSTAPIHIAPTGLAALPRKYGPRWIAVGDAAVKLDPFGSSGTLTALDSGRRAGLAVVEALQGNMASAECYARWSDGLFSEFTRQRKRHYATEAAKRVNGFWSRRSAQSVRTDCN